MSEELQNARKEVWEFARMIAGNLTADQYKEIFQCGGDYEVFNTYTFEGAKEMYEAWSQTNIEVGDICVCDAYTEQFVVTRIFKAQDREWCEILLPNGHTSMIGINAEGLRKTGKKIDIASFLANIEY